MPISILLNADGTDKKISIKNAILLIILTLEAAAIYHRFETNEQDLRTLESLHSQDMEHLRHQIKYERERIDRKFKRLEDDFN